MNSELSFPHHTYQHLPSEEDYEIVPTDLAPPITDPQPADVPSVEQRLHEAGVKEIILVHGTFVGNDAAGVLREVARISPRLAGAMKRLGKHVFDQVTGEIGNYTDSFAQRLSGLVNADGQPKNNSIPVTRLHWSGENHHLGRAGGAIALLDYLFQSDLTSEDRVLVWGHSHGGNVLAMLSHLVGGTDAARNRFFKATRSHYRDPILGRLDLPQWEDVQSQLADAEQRSRLPRIDAANFGVPLRYRWNREVDPRILNYVQHRPLDPEQPAMASVPESIRDVIKATGGDYVQQLGIGGTDFLHSAFAWRSWNAEQRLQRIFEGGIRRRDLLRNLRKCLRVSLDGTTLLVDYPDTQKKWNKKIVGHGVYTRHEWLPFHLNEIANRIYGETKDSTEASP